MRVLFHRLAALLALTLAITAALAPRSGHAQSSPDRSIPGGVWVSPTLNNSNIYFLITNDRLHFAARAYDNPGGSGVAYVNFTANIGGEWSVICTVSEPAAIYGGGEVDLYECDWDLAAQNVPNGDLSAVSFDVYDRDGNKNLSPNGVRRGTALVPGLLAPVDAGITLTVWHGYNDPLPGERCDIGTASDHCGQQKFGLDLAPSDGWDGTILSPVFGTVAWSSGECTGLDLTGRDPSSIGKQLVVCHFGAKFVSTVGDWVCPGLPLGTTVSGKGWVHISLDDGSPHRPPFPQFPAYPFSGAQSLQGRNVEPRSDSDRDQRFDGPGEPLSNFVSRNSRRSGCP